jgi:uncharacterized membrane protein
MRTLSRLALAYALGSSTVYLFDAHAGRRRRVRLRDRVLRGYHDAVGFLDRATRDLTQRVVGTGAEVRYKIAGRRVDDATLARRVSSKLGRCVAHPGAVRVTVLDGCVRLAGKIAASEHKRLVAGIRAVPGVRRIDDAVEVAAAPLDAPSTAQRDTLFAGAMRHSWPPAGRLLAIAGGTALLVSGGRSLPRALGRFGRLAGLILLGRGMTNQTVREMIGRSGDVEHGGIDLQKTLTVAAPIDHVFAFFTDFRSFPIFMRNVKEVRELGQGRSHWKVHGPAGVDASWDAIVTRVEPRKAIAWRSVEGSRIQNAGLIRFEENGPDRTRVHVRMRYVPPAGVVGHAVASLFGADPKTELDEDLLRAKSYLETGKPARDAAVRGAPLSQETYTMEQEGDADVSESERVWN